MRTVTNLLLLLILSLLVQNILSKENSESSNTLSKAYFAGGCFWGVEYFFEKQEGVSDVLSGYMGGWVDAPSYRDVSYTHSGHIEVVEVQYDSKKTNFEKLARLFFEIHDPTQIDAQGPDIGSQYASVIFVNNTSEKKTSQQLIKLLENKGYEIATIIRKKETFWKAEKNHQDYYTKTGGVPYCHAYIKRF